MQLYFFGNLHPPFVFKPMFSAPKFTESQDWFNDEMTGYNVLRWGLKMLKTLMTSVTSILKVCCLFISDFFQM